MSELLVALVAEGPTDYEVIQASLRAILPRTFVLTLLQPEPTRPAAGTGWGGVLKWCDAARQRGSASLDEDLTLEGFDLLIIHLDVDVALATYADYGPEVANLAPAKGWAQLPCAQPCPPVAATTGCLTTVMMSWLGTAKPGNRTVLCLPAQSTGTWLAAATLPAGHALLVGAECNANVESNLGQLAKGLRIKKTVREYRAFATAVAENWASIKAVCGQARAFEQAVLAAL